MSLMKTTALTLALSALATAAASQEVSVVTWAGAIEASQVEAYNTPSIVADFFDLEACPRKHSLARSVKRTLYLALIADGAPAAEVYDLLALRRTKLPRQPLASAAAASPWRA